jgi:Fe-S-cluster containining protein
MNDTPPETPTLRASTELRIGDNILKLNLVVPADEVPPESLLPALHELSNLIVDGVEQKVQKQGVEISCKKGCGACCRQHVPISPAEARLLTAVVKKMPDPGRLEIEKRFAQAAQRLRESGVMDQAMNYHRLSEKETGAMVKDYFELGIACPFLEDESCSVHPFRPLICREYLVISSPSHCAKLEEEHIKRLKLPVSVADTFSSMDGVHKKGENKYIPLIMALEWTEKHSEDCEYRPGPKWVQEFFADLSGAEIPDPDLLE